MMTTFLGNIDLAGSWQTAWTAISGPLGNFSNLMAVVGTLLVVFGLVGYIWERRRGGGGNHQKLIYTIIIGAVLSAPGVVVPALLTALDFVINAIISLVSSTSGTGGATPGG
jgi:RsiW-degrading membrane proteinase PrsW (M82 family)